MLFHYRNVMDIPDQSHVRHHGYGLLFIIGKIFIKPNNPDQINLLLLTIIKLKIKKSSWNRRHVCIKELVWCFQQYFTWNLPCDWTLHLPPSNLFSHTLYKWLQWSVIKRFTNEGGRWLFVNILFFEWWYLYPQILTDKGLDKLSSQKWTYI